MDGHHVAFMSDRAAALRALADDVARQEGVRDAWTAKSFTDRLFVVEMAPGRDLPQAVAETLAEYDLAPAGEAFGVGDGESAYMGPAGGSDRYRFLDTRERGSLQSYVVE